MVRYFTATREIEMLTATLIHRDGNHGSVFLSISTDAVCVDFLPGASNDLRPGDMICVGQLGERGDLITANLQKRLTPRLDIDSG